MLAKHGTPKSIRINSVIKRYARADSWFAASSNGQWGCLEPRRSSVEHPPGLFAMRAFFVRQKRGSSTRRISSSRSSSNWISVRCLTSPVTHVLFAAEDHSSIAPPPGAGAAASVTSWCGGGGNPSCRRVPRDGSTWNAPARCAYAQMIAGKSEGAAPAHCQPRYSTTRPASIA
jgi:hypothetical protein